jgi:hypothetical protein
VLLARMPAPLKAYRHLLSTLSFNDEANGPRSDMCSVCLAAQPAVAYLFLVRPYMRVR